MGKGKDKDDQSKDDAKDEGTIRRLREENEQAYCTDCNVWYSVKRESSKHAH